MASLSSSVNIQAKYDVFLSFRGYDTRHNFTSHLYSALIKKNIEAFVDDDGLQRGNEISPALLKAIEDSDISVIIFSKNYAASRWCLDELAKIIECKNTKGQIVVPVFYHIEPTDVRKQTGSFEKAFVEHEERLKGTPERVQIWRAALTQAADLSGYHVMKNRPEAKFVDEIVQDICKKLTDKSSLTGDCDGLVGINSRIEQLKSLFSKSQVIGIWGMGGIGKTTIAENLFKQISREYDGCCFIENVREELEKSGGRLLQQRIISKILGEKNHDIDTPNTIPQFIKNRLKSKKALIVLDDVNDSRIIDRLIGGLKPLVEESRIIITTRDKQVLLNYGVDNIYEVEGLNYDKAFLLFCKCAFKQNYPIKDLQQLSRMIIKYAGGNPLAIIVLGSALYGKSKEEWDSVKDNLEIIGAPQIDDVLKITFDALEKTGKKIFLDIACFLKGEDEDLAKGVLKACYPSSPFILANLINKSLIKISNKKLQMHDLLQDMGRTIVYQESENNPGKRSRLWHNDDVYDVLQHNKGNEAVESILLDMSRINEMHLSSDAFVNMTNLRLLKLYRSDEAFEYQAKANINRVLLPQGLEYLSNKLIYLHWDGYPLKALPSNFSGEKLVALELSYSNIEQPLEETKHDSMEGYKRLIKVPSSIQYFRNLHVLNMRECHNLKRFPWNIHFTSSVTIDLFGCINLTEFPQISGNVKILDLSDTAIEEVLTTIESLSELEDLEMSFCKKLKSISTSIFKLRPLSTLTLVECSKLETFPDITEEMENLTGLDSTETTIKELPSSIENLHWDGYPLKALPSNFSGEKLVALELLYSNIEQPLEETTHDSMEGYKRLIKVPSSIQYFCNLRVLNMEGCYNLKRFPWNTHFTSSVAINLSGCINLTEFPQISGKVKRLDLSHTAIEEVPTTIASLFELKDLKMSFCEELKSIPKSIKQLSKLVVLHLENCDSLQSIPELPLRVESLSLSNCKRLQSLPELPSNEEQFDLKDDPPTKCFEIRFRFENCLNLKETVSLQRMLHVANVLRHRYGKVSCILCWPVSAKIGIAGMNPSYEMFEVMFSG